MSTKAIDYRIKLEGVAFWISMGSVMVMSVLFLAEADDVILDLPFLTITTAGLFGLIAAFSYGLHASLKGQPGKVTGKHIIFATLMAVICLVLYVVGYTSFKLITALLV